LKLPIAKRLIEIQGGKLKFNVSEKGVEFMIELPKL